MPPLYPYSAQPMTFSRRHRYECSGAYKPLGLWVSVPVAEVST